MGCRLFSVTVPCCGKDALVFAHFEAGGMGQHLEADKSKKIDFALEPLGKNTDLLRTGKGKKIFLFLFVFSLEPPRKIADLPHTGKGKKMEFFLEPPGKHADLLHTLVFAQWTADLQNCKILNLCLFKLLKLW